MSNYDFNALKSGITYNILRIESDIYVGATPTETHRDLIAAHSLKPRILALRDIRPQDLFPGTIIKKDWERLLEVGEAPLEPYLGFIAHPTAIGLTELDLMRRLAEDRIYYEVESVTENELATTLSRDRR